MVWARRGFLFLLSLVLLVSLVGLAFSVSAKTNLTHPEKIQAWLKQSDFYSSFVSNELHDAQNSASNDLGAGRVSLSDPDVVQAVQSVLSPTLLQRYANTFLNGNYAWLQGKTPAPEFTIDLTPAKQQLGQEVGQRVETRLAGLQVCSAAQLTQLQATLTTDPLAIPCRPPTLDAKIAAAQATVQIQESKDFLNTPVLTPRSLNPNGGKQSQPYYQKLSSLPKLYRLNLKLPWIFGGLAVLSLLGVLFVSPTRRRGVRRTAWMLLTAGVVLIGTKFLADTAFNHLEKKLFDSNIGQLQQSLNDFSHRLETQIVKVYLWFGIAFLLLAALVWGILWFTRRRSGDGKPKPPPIANDEIGGGQGTDGRPPLPALKPAARPKRPRLIQ